jgi:hypothetical protein
MGINREKAGGIRQGAVQVMSFGVRIYGKRSSGKGEERRSENNWKNREK